MGKIWRREGRHSKMPLCSAVVLLKTPPPQQQRSGAGSGVLFIEPFILHTASLLTPTRAMCVIDCLVPSFERALGEYEKFHAREAIFAPAVSDLVDSNPGRAAHFREERDVAACLRGDVVVDECFRASYLVIPEKSLALVVLAPSADNAFEAQKVLNRTKCVLETTLGTMGSKRDAKLSFHRRLEKLHGELYLLTHRALLGHGTGTVVGARHFHDIDLSSDVKITHNKRGSSYGAASAVGETPSISEIGNLWKPGEPSKYGDDPAHDIFQLNFSHHFQKVRALDAASQKQKEHREKNVFLKARRKSKVLAVQAVEASAWKLSAADAKMYISSSFDTLKDKKTNLCHGKVAFNFFKRRTDEHRLKTLYSLCSIKKTESLTPRMFGVLMHMVAMTAVKKPPLPVPKTLPVNLAKILAGKKKRDE